MRSPRRRRSRTTRCRQRRRSEEHTSELQSRQYLVCRLLLEKKKTSSFYSLFYSVLYSSTSLSFPFLPFLPLSFISVFVVHLYPLHHRFMPLLLVSLSLLSSF